jgi:hypothetical protein
MVIIYGLIDPRTNQLRYVGQTNNLQKRFKEHIYHSELKRSTTHKHNWIRGLVSEGLKPDIEVLDVVSLDQSGYWEGWWMNYMEAIGCNLVNSLKVGQTVVHNELSRKKIAEGLRGKKYTKRKFTDHGNKKYDINVDFLKSLYISENMTKAQVASRIGVSERTIKHLLKSNGIKK